MKNILRLSLTLATVSAQVLLTILLTSVVFHSVAIGIALAAAATLVGIAWGLKKLFSLLSAALFCQALF